MDQGEFENQQRLSNSYRYTNAELRKLRRQCLLLSAKGMPFATALAAGLHGLHLANNARPLVLDEMDEDSRGWHTRVFSFIDDYMSASESAELFVIAQGIQRCQDFVLAVDDLEGWLSNRIKAFDGQA